MSESTSHQIRFRPLERRDFALMIKWQNAEHAARWFQESPKTLAQAEAKYGPRIDGQSPVRMHILEVDGAPVGHLQHYLADDFPAYAAAVDVPYATGIDFIIGESELVGKGLGPNVIRQYIENVVRRERPTVTRVVADPDPANLRSVRALEKAGFRLGAIVQINAKDARVCVYDLTPP